jgi:hypothetical protein
MAILDYFSKFVQEIKIQRKGPVTSFPYNVHQQPLPPSPFETPTNYKFRFLWESCEKIEPSPLMGEGAGEGVR